jgi:hypothetical protein
MGFYVAENATDIIMQWKKKEFFENDLPLIVRQTKILNISFNELKPYFEQ